MKVVNIGSINIDTVYYVDHFVQPGETESAYHVEQNAGGKGMNQSVSLARAGCSVWHAGRIGKDGKWLRKLLQEEGINTEYLEIVDTPTGNAMIQLTNHGENAIILYGGANQTIDMPFVDKVLASCNPEDVIVLQNEIACMNEILEKIHRLGLRVALNPAPMNDTISLEAMATAHWLILNEAEAQELTGKKDIMEQLKVLRKIFSETIVVITAGEDGAWYQDTVQTIHVGACKVSVEDTTAAGDTFIGFFLAEWLRTETAEQAITAASQAAAIAVSRKGAVKSIPTFEEVKNCYLEPTCQKVE